jgi:hypothetical protein
MQGWQEELTPAERVVLAMANKYGHNWIPPSRRSKPSLAKQMAIAVLDGDEVAALALADKLIEERKDNYQRNQDGD